MSENFGIPKKPSAPAKTTPKYRIAEWFGIPFKSMPPTERQSLAKAALGENLPPPPCPFQPGKPECRKKGGVCSLSAGDMPPVIVCPKRFQENGLLHQWLGEIVGFEEIFLAHEVPFMKSPETGREAARIDLVVSGTESATQWYGLEIQAVYFSGPAMKSEFEALLTDFSIEPPPPKETRRPDWRSSSAKRLLPQIWVKGELLRQWLTKLAVAVDMPFFRAIGGPSASPSHDLSAGDIIWLVPQINESFRLERHHWEVLTLDDSSKKLRAAEAVARHEFEKSLRKKLKPM